MEPRGGSAEKPQFLYGLHAVLEALRGGNRSFIRVLVARKEGQFSEIVQRCKEALIPVLVQPKMNLDRMVPSGHHQGVIAVVGQKSYSSPEDMLAHARGLGEPPCIVLLDGVVDPHNLGAVLRSAEGAGVHGVCIPDRRAAGLNATVSKTSAGALEHIRVASVANLSRVIEHVQAEGLWVYGLDPQGHRPYVDVDLCGPVALVLGGEEKGLRPGVLAKCDERITIPLRGKVSSLNVSAAAAIVLFEMARQRARHEGGGRATE